MCMSSLGITITIMELLDLGFYILLLELPIYDLSYRLFSISLYTVAVLMHFLFKMKCIHMFRREKRHNMYRYSIWIVFSKHRTLSNADSLSDKNINMCNILIINLFPLTD